jgi:nucleoid DNA-binding protein
MGEFFDQLPEFIKPHIESITKTSGLPYSEEFVDLIAKNWLEKKRMFEEQTILLRMVHINSLSRDTRRAALMLTYSGSLISIGIPAGNKRWAEYASIGLREDVPNIVVKTDAVLGADIHQNGAVEFESGPVKKSSPLLTVAACGEEVSSAEQENRIREATIFLTNGFVKLNRTLISSKESYPEQFTLQSMIAYAAAKNGITQKLAKRIIEDYISLIETGVLLGEKVPLGKLGKMFLRKRPSQKARVGRNPGTGKEITIGAKPERWVPMIAFSRSLKEKAYGVRTDR